MANSRKPSNRKIEVRIWDAEAGVWEKHRSYSAIQAAIREHDRLVEKDDVSIDDVAMFVGRRRLDVTKKGARV